MIRREKLTNANIKSLKPLAKEYTVWDDEFHSLGIRIRDTGQKSFILSYQDETYSTKVTLCKFPEYTITEAREIARERHDDLVKGKDPFLKRNNQYGNITMKELLDRYFKEYSQRYKKPSTIIDEEKRIKNHIKPVIGHLKAGLVTTAEMSNFHASMSKSPYSANRILAIVSHMFTWAMQMEILEPRLNPCQYVRKYKENKREKFLTKDELKRLSKAIDIVEASTFSMPSIIAAIKLLLFTGCRRGEILNLTWAEVDFEYKCLRLKDSKTGSKIVSLGEGAIEILASIPRIEGNSFVITGKCGIGHIENIKNTWGYIRTLAELPDLRIHDLRHNFASIGVCDNMSLSVIGKLLGHSQISTTQRYAHLQSDPLREAANRINSQIKEFMKP